MAKDEAKETTLLQKLSEVQLGTPGTGVPATREEPEEIREPVEIEREKEPGRRPEEVVVQPEGAPAKPEVKAPAEKEEKWKIDGEDLTLPQIIERGLIRKLITTAQQFPTVQRKYQELLERHAGKEVAKPADVDKPVVPPPPTPEQIKSAYAPMLQEMVEAGHMEADFAEAYPQHAVELMYYRDVIESHEEKIRNLMEWVKSEVGVRNARTAQGMMDKSIDAVAAKVDEKGAPDPIFQGLKTPATRAEFVKWLRDDLDPKVGSLTPENMERYWLAFNAKDILDFSKKAAEKSVVTQPRKRAASDGTGARPGTKESDKPKSLLDRMSEHRLGPEA